VTMFGSLSRAGPATTAACAVYTGWNQGAENRASRPMAGQITRNLRACPACRALGVALVLARPARRKFGGSRNRGVSQSKPRIWTFLHSLYARARADFRRLYWVQIRSYSDRQRPTRLSVPRSFSSSASHRNASFSPPTKLRGAPAYIEPVPVTASTLPGFCAPVTALMLSLMLLAESTILNGPYARARKWNFGRYGRLPDAILSDWLCRKLGPPPGEAFDLDDVARCRNAAARPRKRPSRPNR
jgi:hypothetical protein